MYKRELYLKKLRPFYQNEQIKILTGVRRAGKTELLKMVQEEIRKQFPDSLIQYISFELLENRQYRNAPSLYSHLESCLDSEKWNFIFLDEIQFVDGWPEVVNSLKTKYH